MRKSLLVGLAVAAPILICVRCFWPAVGAATVHHPTATRMATRRPAFTDTAATDTAATTVRPTGTAATTVGPTDTVATTVARTDTAATTVQACASMVARTYGWRGGVGVRRVGWGGRRRW